MRYPRCPVPGGLFEITTSVTGQHRLMKPTKAVTAIVLGVLGRAQAVSKRFGRVRLHAFVFMSGHYHLLVSVDDARALSDFMQHLNGNLSRQFNRLYERSGVFWERRFRAIPLTPDEATQRYRLRYLLSHGVKENLVGKVEQWPGASSVPWLLHAKKLVGVWIDRSRERDCLRRKHAPVDESEYRIVYELELEVLPCWKELPPETWRRLVKQMVVEIEATFARERQTLAARLAGLVYVLAAEPWSRSVQRLRKSAEERQAPLVHALDEADREAWTAYLKEQRARYREASRAFRGGDWEVAFPAGTFRPGGGFVAPGGPVPLSVITG